MSRLTFHYRAVDPSGSRTSGVLEAASLQEAYRRLSSDGLVATSMRQAGGQAAASSGRRRRLFGSRISREEIAHFTYQFSVLLQARIPVVECFTSSAEQENNPAFRAVLHDIAARVQSGSNITDSMAEHRAIFGNVYIETIRAAERTGNMIEVLGHLATMVEDEVEMTRIVRGALLYPVSVLIALSLAITFLLMFVVPRFASMFESRGVELPLLTRALQAVGVSMQSYWWAWLGAIVGSVVLSRRAWRNPVTRARIDTWLHRIPYLNRLLVALAMGRFSSIFGLSLSSGLGLIDSLDMAGRATARPMLQADTDRLISQVRQGGRLNEVIPTCAYFPAFVKQLLSAGETSAELPRMCGIISRHYHRESKHLARNAATVIEPILIAVLTGTVLVVALAIFLPMWDMVSLLQ
ncbi:MAG: type II secretion system F family protein [Phycisphaerales bacterium]|nr:type II secretion system F family protein [Phycisphaerales bacterium]